MLKEDYVSFELAKLLKEKGFDEPFFFFYRADDKVKNIHHAHVTKPLSYHQKYIDDEVVNAPTHQTAMAWLRNKGVYMSIDTVISSSGNSYFNIDTYSEDSGWNHPVDFYDSYEEAVEAALKYSLENLI